MEPTSLLAALATPLSHFVTSPFGLSVGIVPSSSPPNGVAATGTPRGECHASTESYDPELCHRSLIVAM
jgi:hypothetical protein